MKLLHFDRRIAGAKTIWVIQFKPDPDHGEKLLTDFIIPAPEGGDCWMVADLKSTKNSLNSLQNIQHICGNLKEECEKRIREIHDHVEPGSQLAKGIEALDELIRQFNEIMRRFKTPPEEKEREGKQDPQAD